MALPPPTHDKYKFARSMHPGLGYCGRCGVPWTRKMMILHHETPYEDYHDVEGSGRWFGERKCFPLCQPCWELLETPEARWPYYAALLEHWRKDIEVSAAVEMSLLQSVLEGL